MRKLLFLTILASLFNIAWITPRPTSQFIASMDVLPATTDTHSVGINTNFWENGYFQNIVLPYRISPPTNIASRGIVWASTDKELYFTDSDGTSTQIS